MTPNRVVATGVGMVSPLGLNTESTWKALLSGRSGVDQITAFDTDGYGTTIAAEVKDFEPQGLLGRKESRRMDRFVQLAAAATLESAESSGNQDYARQQFAGVGDDSQRHRWHNYPFGTGGRARESRSEADISLPCADDASGYGNPDKFP